MYIMISEVTTTTIIVPGDVLGLFLPPALILSFIVSFIVTYIKCESYRCSIKYSLLTGAIIGTIYGIVVWHFMILPQFTDISLDPGLAYPFGLSIYIFSIYITIEVLVNMVVGLLGGWIASGLKKAPK